MNEYVTLVVVLAAAVYLLANAVYAILSPKKFLTDRWTRGWRGVPSGTPIEDVRWFALTLIVLVGFFGFLAYKIFMSIWRG